ncbi:MAG: MBL fold metallo-hydrolase [Oscillospiraceae bacterium]|jgi:beta-lactamase superfamily II metal-dependent hydrolase|nr:MBL fold metallo-hydrolase [Oscillospiraceae bacterium]
MQRTKKQLLLILLVLTICFNIFTVGCRTDNYGKHGILEIVVFNVGRADAILITTKNHTVMIDTGDRRHVSKIVNYLFDRDLLTIDYLIITHFDGGHVGGAAEIINSVDVKNIVVPNYLRASGNYRRFVNAMYDNALVPFVLERYDLLEFILDGVEFITYPSDLDFFEYIVEQGSDEDDNEYNIDGDGDADETTGAEVNVNNYSLITSIKHGNNDFLFTGDSKARRIREILAIEKIAETDFDFLKVPHHGEYNRRSAELINTISPRYAVITDSFDRSADEMVLAILNDVEAEIFSTQKGNLYFTSNGDNIFVLIEE